MFLKSSCYIIYLSLLMTILTVPFSCAEFKESDGDESQKRQKVEFSSLPTESVLSEGKTGCDLKDVARTFKYLHNTHNYQLFTGGSDFDKAKKLQKLCYFANAVHMHLHGAPISYTKFEAHLHGAYAKSIQYMKSAPPDDLPSLPQEAISSSKFIASALQPYTGEDLSELMHEEGLPWQKIRKPKGLGDPHEKWGVLMPLDSYREYMNDERVQAAIVKGLVCSVIEQDEETLNTFFRFCSKNPKVLESRLLELQVEIKQLLEKLLKESSYEGFLNHLRSKNPAPRRLLKFIPHIFVHQYQSLAQGTIAEAVFPYSSIEQGEIYLIQDPQFQIRVALGTACNCIPAFYYMRRTLKLVFDLEDHKQRARVRELKKLVKNKFQKLVGLLIQGPLEEEPYWQDVYARALAFFYKEEYEQASQLLKHFLEKFADAPPFYRKDAYWRQAFLTSDKAVLEAAKKEFPREFLLSLASNQENITDTIKILSEALISEIPKAYFELGKLLLSGVDFSTMADLPEANQKRFSEDPQEAAVDLLITACKKDVREALGVLADYYEEQNDLGQAIKVCNDLPENDWVLYTKALLLEKSGKVEEAFDIYSELETPEGFENAARLAKTEKDESHYLDKKNRYYEELIESIEGVLTEEVGVKL